MGLKRGLNCLKARTRNEVYMYYSGSTTIGPAGPRVTNVDLFHKDGNHDKNKKTTRNNFNTRPRLENLWVWEKNFSFRPNLNKKKFEARARLASCKL